MVITVVAALIEIEGKVLIAKRATGNPDLLGKWEFPGGKVEMNETEEIAIEREIKEEFEIDIKAYEYLTNNISECPDKTVDLKLYKCNYIDGEISLHDHFEYILIKPNELLNYDLAPADIPLAQFVINMYKEVK